MSALATAVSFKLSACVPRALGSFRLATGYLSMHRKSSSASGRAIGTSTSRRGFGGNVHAGAPAVRQRVRLFVGLTWYGPFGRPAGRRLRQHLHLGCGQGRRRHGPASVPLRAEPQAEARAS
jgi:hypothetical protein